MLSIRYPHGAAQSTHSREDRVVSHDIISEYVRAFQPQHDT